jgi:hypothetical protein
MNNYLAQVIGQVTPPPGVRRYIDIASNNAEGGLQLFISNIIKTIIVIAGVFALFNLIFAGFAFMSAGGNAEKIAGAWAKIWQTMIGLLIAVGSFVLAGVFGKLIFGDYNALLQLRIFGP